jgi:Uri superfamily endonuclease
MEEVISDSRAVKSFGSSDDEDEESFLEEEEEEVLASSRAALAPFFWRVGLVVNRRWGVRG